MVKEKLQKAVSDESLREVFCRYIRRNGKIVYPKNKRFFHFWVKVSK